MPNGGLQWPALRETVLEKMLSARPVHAVVRQNKERPPRLSCCLPEVCFSALRPRAAATSGIPYGCMSECINPIEEGGREATEAPADQCEIEAGTGHIRPERMVETATDGMVRQRSRLLRPLARGLPD